MQASPQHNGNARRGRRLPVQRRNTHQAQQKNKKRKAAKKHDLEQKAKAVAAKSGHLGVKFPQKQQPGAQQVQQKQPD